jgi:hypothetical protein
VTKQRSDRLPVRLTAAVVRGNTDLRVGIGGHVVSMHRDRRHTVSRAVGVTVTGAENLRTAITTGLTNLVSRRQKSTGNQALAGTDD